jgi:hypothetical protein
MGGGAYHFALGLVGKPTTQQGDVHISCFINFWTNGGNAIELSLECIFVFEVI